MLQRRAGNRRRLGARDYLEIQRRVFAGETYEFVASALGCSTKSIQRLMLRTGGVGPEVAAAITLEAVLGGARGAVPGSSGWGLSAWDSTSSGAGAVDAVARGGT